MDEAGRGPVLGPLVLAGVVGDPQTLAELGARDSKLVSPPKREHVARRIRAEAQVFIAVVEASVLDLEMANQSLNAIELQRFSSLAVQMQEAGATRIVVDAADVNAARFGAAIQSHVQCPVESYHKADANYPCVAAASIIAKVERDRRMAMLARRLEPRIGRELGSGYPSDPKTVAFLHAWLAAEGELPPETRHRWATSKRLLASQRSLGEFSPQP